MEIFFDSQVNESKRFQDKTQILITQKIVQTMKIQIHFRLTKWVILLRLMKFINSDDQSLEISIGKIYLSIQRWREI